MRRVRPLLQKARKISDFLYPMQIPLHSAHTGFFLVLSVFPALLLFLGLLRYTDYGVQDVMSLLEGVLPQSLLPTVESLVEASYRHSSGTIISVSVLAALWSASKGTYGLLRGLNAVYGIDDRRPYWRIRGVSILYTFLFLVGLVLTLVMHVFGNAIVDYLWMTTNPPLMRLLNLIDLHLILLLLLQTVLFTTMFTILPGQKQGLRRSLPGAVLTSIGWSVYSRLFSVYVDYFTVYTNIYGSVYAVALGMLWLYFCISILFYGGAFNRYLAERKSKKE